MSTKLILIIDERGFTVQISTTHHTKASALAHFMEIVAQLHRNYTIYYATEKPQKPPS